MNPSAPTADPAEPGEPGDSGAASVATDPAGPTGRVAIGDDRILGGVAGFIATRLGIDPLWVRIGFVLLALAGGIGVVLYVGLWLVLTADRSTPWRWPRIAGGAIVVVGIPLLLDAQAGRFVTGPVAVVLLLTGLALALWRPPAALGGVMATTIDDRPPSSLAPPIPSPAMENVPPGGHEADRRARGRPHFPRRPPSVLGRAALGLAIAVAAAGALVDEANGGRLHPEQWLGAAAIVCGLGLLVGTLRGHGRWLIVPAIAFAGAGYASGISARLGIDTSDMFGERWVMVGQDEPGGLRIAHTAFGSIDLYIDGVPDDLVVIDARVGIGDIAIQVSDQVSVEVRSRVDDGVVTVAGGRTGRDGPVHVGAEGPVDVVVEAWVGRGDVHINRSLRGLPAVEVVPVVPVVEPRLPALDAPLAFVSDAVAATADGWIVLGEGEAVIDPDDVLVVGEQFTREDGVRVVWTQYGEFQLLPRSLLITPFGQVLDLQTIRAELAVSTPGATPSTTPSTTGPTVQTTVATTGG